MMKTRHLGLVVLLSTVALAAGAPIDDAKRKAAAADSAATSVITKLTQIGRTISARQDALNRLLRTLEEAQERQSRMERIVLDVLRQSEAEVSTETRDLKSRQEEAQQARQLLTAAKSRLATARRSLDAATAGQKKEFEATAEFVHARESVAACESEVARLRQELETRSEADAAVKTARDLLKQAEAEVKSARSASPADDDAVADASARWIEAKNAFNNAFDSYLGQQAPYQNALANLAEAQQALAVLISRFETSVASLPGVADALLAMKSAAVEVRAAEGAVKAADDAADRAAVSVQRRKAEVAQLRKIKLDFESESKATEDEIRRLQLDLRAVNGQLGDAIDDLTGLRSALRSVSESLRTIDNEAKKQK